MVRWDSVQSIAHMRDYKLYLKERSWNARACILFLVGCESRFMGKSQGYGVPRRLRKATGLPVEDGREELRDQPLVIWLEPLGIDGFVGFGVQVVRVECPDGSQCPLICLVAQMAVRAFPVPSREHAAMT